MVAGHHGCIIATGPRHFRALLALLILVFSLSAHGKVQLKDIASFHDFNGDGTADATYAPTDGIGQYAEPICHTPPCTACTFNQYSGVSTTDMGGGWVNCPSGVGLKILHSCEGPDNAATISAYTVMFDMMTDTGTVWAIDSSTVSRLSFTTFLSVTTLNVANDADILSPSVLPTTITSGTGQMANRFWMVVDLSSSSVNVYQGADLVLVSSVAASIGGKFQLTRGGHVVINAEGAYNAIPTDNGADLSTIVVYNRALTLDEMRAIGGPSRDYQRNGLTNKADQCTPAYGLPVDISAVANAWWFPVSGRYDSMIGGSSLTAAGTVTGLDLTTSSASGGRGVRVSNANGYLNAPHGMTVDNSGSYRHVYSMIMDVRRAQDGAGSSARKIATVGATSVRLDAADQLELYTTNANLLDCTTTETMPRMDSSCPSGCFAPCSTGTGNEMAYTFPSGSSATEQYRRLLVTSNLGNGAGLSSFRFYMDGQMLTKHKSTTGTTGQEWFGSLTPATQSTMFYDNSVTAGIDVSFLGFYNKALGCAESLWLDAAHEAPFHYYCPFGGSLNVVNNTCAGCDYPYNKDQYCKDNTLHGDSLYFDGVDDYVTFSGTSTDLTGHTMTVSVWIHPKTVTGQRHIVTRGPWYLFLENGFIKFKVNGAMGAGDLVSRSAIYPDRWTHVLVSYGDGYAELFMNGVHDASAAHTTSVAAETVTLDIGRCSGALCGGAGYFHGYIDEVKVWKSRFTQQQAKDQWGRELYQRFEHEDPYALSSFSALVDVDGLYANFDEASGTATADRSSSGTADGTISGAIYSVDNEDWKCDIPQIAGMFCHGLYLNGSTSVEISITGNLDVKTLTEWTLDFHMNKAVDGVAMDIITYGQDTTWGGFSISVTADNKMKFSFLRDNDTLIIPEQYLDAGTWHQWTFVYDKPMIRVHRDGEFVIVKQHSEHYSMSWVGTGKMHIGSYFGYMANGFQGIVDEVRVFNTRLTTAQVAAASHRSSTLCDYFALIGYWRFDDALGDVVRDSSPLGNNGYTNGTGQWTTRGLDIIAPGSNIYGGMYHIFDGFVPGIDLDFQSDTTSPSFKANSSALSVHFNLTASTTINYFSPSSWKWSVGTKMCGSDLLPKESMTHIDIANGVVRATLTNLALVAGNTYYTCVYFSSAFSMCSNGTTVVSSGPVTTGVSIVVGSYQTELDRLYAQFSGFTDPAEVVAYEWTYAVAANLATASYRSDGISWNSTLGVIEQDGLSLTTGTAYTIRIRAINRAGKVSYADSGTIMVDSSAPTYPGQILDSSHGYDVDHQNEDYCINATWVSFVDVSTPLDYYEWAIGTTSGGVDIMDWQKTSPSIANSQSNCSLSGLLVNSVTYYVSVRATNLAGLTSLIYTSNGTMVDTVDPVSPTNVVNVTEVSKTLHIYYQNSTTEMHASWDAFTDTPSGMLRYTYAISSGTAGLANVATGSIDSLSPNTVTVSSLSLTTGTVYYMTIVGWDRALRTTTVHSQPVTVDTEAPYTGIVNDGAMSRGVYALFDGTESSYIKLNNDSGVLDPLEGTVEAWILPDKVLNTACSGTSLYVIAERYPWIFGLQCVENSGDQRGARMVFHIDGKASQFFSKNTHIVPHGRWVHVAVSFSHISDGGNGHVRMYMDGYELQSVQMNSGKQAPYEFGSLHVGGCEGTCYWYQANTVCIPCTFGTVYNFQGGISNLRVFNSSRDAEQIEFHRKSASLTNSTSYVYGAEHLLMSLPLQSEDTYYGIGSYTYNLTYHQNVSFVEGIMWGDVDYTSNTVVTAAIGNFSDALSSVSKYEWAFGTSQDSTTPPRFYSYNHYTSSAVSLTTNEALQSYTDKALDEMYVANFTMVSGTHYHSTIRVSDLTGWSSIMVSDGFIYDASYPTITTLYDGPDTTADLITQGSISVLNCTATGIADPESGIKLIEWSIGTVPGNGDVLAWVSDKDTNATIRMNSARSIDDLYLSYNAPSTSLAQDGVTIYHSLRITNYAGLSHTYHSNGVTLDTSKPIGNVVMDGPPELADVDYQTDNTTIWAYFPGFYDPDSDIETIHWYIGTTAGGSDVMASTQLTNRTAVNATKTGLTLSHGTTYYVTVVFTNFQGISLVKTSDGVTIDVYTPVPLVIHRGPSPSTDQEASNTLSVLPFVWKEFDIGTSSAAVSFYEWKLGTYPGGGDIFDWTRDNITRSMVYDDSGAAWVIGAARQGLTEGLIAYATVRSTDTIGQVSFTIGTTEGFIIDTQEPTTASTASYMDTVVIHRGTNITAHAYSNKFTHDFAVSWDPILDNVQYHEWAIGTSAGGTDIMGWTTSGITDSTRSAAKDSVALPSYNHAVAYVSIRAKSQSSGEFETVSFLQPTADVYLNDTVVYANWNYFHETTSGSSSYYYSVGTKPFVYDILPFTADGITMGADIVTAVITGLTLVDATPYYLTIRAVDRANNVGLATSEAFYSDWIA